MTIIATGIDLAKTVFAVHGVSQGGSEQLRQPKVAHGKLNALIAARRPDVIGMEACFPAHHWARQFQAHGHTVRLTAPKLVAPYRMNGKRGKNDAADAAAVCKVMQRPTCAWCRSSPGSASAADGAPPASGLCHRAHRLHQSHPRAAQRVRRRDHLPFCQTSDSTPTAALASGRSQVQAPRDSACRRLTAGAIDFDRRSAQAKVSQAVSQAPESQKA